MNKSNINSKVVEVQFTFVESNGCDKETATVYSFAKETITSVIDTDIICANYRLGQVEDDKFWVFYIGRVTGELLRQRLLEHVDEFANYKNGLSPKSQL